MSRTIHNIFKLNNTYMPSPQHLWFLILCYCMVILLANWFDPRLISLFGLVTDAGTLIFPLTFILSDLMTEVYGYRQARRAIWCGFVFNLFFVLYGQLIIHMPSPNFETNNALFDQMHAVNIRIIIASFISYLIAEPLNSYLMAKLKIRMHGQYMGLRFVLSTLIASGIDSIMFTGLAFYGSMDNINLLKLALSMWFIKVMIEIIGLPFSIRATKKLKVIEQLDIYDSQTHFSIFQLDNNYMANDNEFNQTKI